LGAEERIVPGTFAPFFAEEEMQPVLWIAGGAAGAAADAHAAKASGVVGRIVGINDFDVRAALTGIIVKARVGVDALRIAGAEKKPRLMLKLVSLTVPDAVASLSAMVTVAKDFDGSIV